MSASIVASSLSYKLALTGYKLAMTLPMKHAGQGYARCETLTVLTGLSGSGKSSWLIRLLRSEQEAGRSVALYLSAENSILTRRPNVVPGGIMGCRSPGLSFKITDVLRTEQAIEKLRQAAPGSLVAFDEAQYFQPSLVEGCIDASRRGVNVILSTPSVAQLTLLKTFGIKPTNLSATCASCGRENSTVVVYKANLKEPTPVCADCETEHYKNTVRELLADVKESEPFKGEKKTYQPFYDIPMDGWTFVRGDSLARFEIIRDALEHYPHVKADPHNPGKEVTYVDVGCCSGFFCDAFTSHGYTATGVDVTKHFIDWAKRVALLKRQNITHLQQDAEKFLTSSDSKFDITSSFATIQWVMAQRGYAAGVNCFKHLFDRTRHVCVVEMGYSTEDIYKTKILDRPSEIDKDWVLRIMNEHGNFAHIDFYPAGHRGIWRDLFIGYKHKPSDPNGQKAEPVEATVTQHTPSLSIRERIRRILAR